MVIKTLPIPSTKPNGNNQLGSKRQLSRSLSGLLSCRYYTFSFLYSYAYSCVLIIVSCPPDSHSEQRRLPDAADLRRMCIITKSDLNRIYDNLDRRQRDKDAVRQEIERKKEISERSAQIAKQWPNTIIVRLTLINKNFSVYFFLYRVLGNVNSN